MRPPLLTCVIVAVALLAMPASAKRGVRAQLDQPVRLDTAPGKKVRVAWHLVDEDGRRFGASGSICASPVVDAGR